jgi:uncharacterized protein
LLYRALLERERDDSWQILSGPFESGNLPLCGELRRSYFSRVNPVPGIEAVPPIIPASPQTAFPPPRIESLDVLRGFAVLGILVMNIQNFALINAAYANPTAHGDLTGVNRAVWLLSHVFADQKFLTIFSILFGAGIALFAGKWQAQGQPAARLHYRRMFWLLIAGLIHGYLFWHGDILVTYALVGCVVFGFRNVKPVWLAFWGVAALAVASLVFLLCSATLPFWPVDALEDLRADWHPDPATQMEEIEGFRGSFLSQVAYRAEMTFMMQTGILLLWSGWRTGGLMLLGMALLKWSVLSGIKSSRAYAGMAATGMLFGLPLISYGVHRNFQEGWSLEYSLFAGPQWNYWGSLGVATTYIGIILLAQKQGWLPRVRQVLAKVGRMALTNYLLQTLLCTMIFYGHGLGWFGRLERWELVSVVLLVWAAQIIFTLLWLRRFSQGPFEWGWRRLTYSFFSARQRT